MEAVVGLAGAGDVVRRWVSEIAGCDGRELIERLQDVERHLRLVESAVVAVLAEAERTGAHLEDGHGSTAGWCRAAVRWSDAEARSRLRCVHLAADSPQVAAALAEGQVGVAQVRELARARANPRVGAQLSDVVDVLLGHAATLDFDGFRQVVRRWEMLADIDGAHRDEELNHDRRDALLGWGGQVLHLAARFGAVQGAWIAEVFEAFEQAEWQADVEAARAKWGDQVTRGMLERTPAQRRADALHAIFLAAATAPPDGVAAPTVNVVIDAATFEAALAAAATGHDMPPLGITGATLDARRCETVGGVALTPAAVVAAAVVGYVRRVVIGADGVVINLGRRSRVFTGSAREAVWIRRRLCVWVGCRSRRCDVDHRLAWIDGGETDQDNADPLCSRHNHTKQRGLRPRYHPDHGWRLHRPDGTVTGPI